MYSNKVHFKQALKKQIWAISIVIVSIVAYPTLVGGLNTDLAFYTWILLVLSSSALVFVLLKKQSKEALCPHCESDLFEIIEVSKSVKLDFNFCPCCSNPVEI